MTEQAPAPAAGRSLRVLMVEDSEDDTHLIRRALEREGFKLEAERVQNAADLAAALRRDSWDVVLSDHSMPSFSSETALRMVREHDPDLPFIIVSGSIGEDMAVAAMKAGAHDFVMKSKPGRLVPAIERELRDAEIRRARRAAEDALRASESRYRELVEELPAVTYVSGLDEARTAYFVSKQIESLLGIPPGDHRHLWKTHVHPEDWPRIGAALEEARLRGGAFTCEYRMVGPDQRVVWLQDHGMLVRDASGQPVFARGFMLDITKRKEAETTLDERDEQLRRIQKLEAIGRLAGGVAHDFNNLLTPVLGYAHLLQRELQDQPELKNCVDEIVKAADRAAKLTHQLLTFSRRRSEKRQAVDVNAILTDMHRFLRRTIGEDIELSSILCEQPVVVEIDPTNLEQVIMNLAVNARDAMSRGGRLIIRTSVVDIDEANARLFGAPPGAYAQITVSDNGCGMTPEVREHIFEPFFSTKPEGQGTGLGLSIIYGIVKQCGGFIDVDTAPGDGTEFRLHFPRIEAPAGEVHDPAMSDPPRGHETILIVEDEESVRQLTSRILRSLGYRVIEAAAPSEALALWNEKAKEIDAIVSDVVMPQMSGHEMAALLRRDKPGLPILFISGFDRREPDAGDADVPVLMKPFSRDSLAIALRSALTQA